MKKIILCLALGLPSVAGGQDAGVTDQHPAPLPDFERALAAVERGEILPLATLMPRMEQMFSGRIVKVELELEGSFIAYEFEILTDAGRLIEVDVAGATGEILEIEGLDEDGTERGN